MKKELYTEKHIALPDSLVEKLNKSAKQGDRSLTAEIVRRLERSFAEQPLTTGHLITLLVQANPKRSVTITFGEIKDK